MTDEAEYFERATTPDGERLQVVVSHGKGGSGPVFLHAPGALGFVNGFLGLVSALMRRVQPAVRRHESFRVFIIRESDEATSLDDREFKAAGKAGSHADSVVRQIADGALDPTVHWREL